MLINNEMMGCIKKFFFIFFIIFKFDTANAVVQKLNNNEIKNNMHETAVFSMGCFWCGESEFRDHNSFELLDGIISIRVGFAGGSMKNPTYSNHEGYKEAVKIVYDSKKISYYRLLDIFWRNIDPFDDKGQFCDRGFSYTAAIFYKNENQHRSALKSLKIQQEKFNNQKILTKILPYSTFVDAEEYHQNYTKKNPVRYKYYRWNCGRDKRLKEVWGNSF